MPGRIAWDRKGLFLTIWIFLGVLLAGYALYIKVLLGDEPGHPLGPWLWDHGTNLALGLAIGVIALRQVRSQSVVPYVWCAVAAGAMAAYGEITGIVLERRGCIDDTYFDWVDVLVSVVAVIVVALPGLKPNVATAWGLRGGGGSE